MTVERDSPQPISFSESMHLAMQQASSGLRDGSPSPGVVNPTVQGKAPGFFITPEVRQFMELPPELQRQVLRYGVRWREGVSR